MKDQRPTLLGSIQLGDIEREEVLRLSALNYTPKEIALYLGIDDTIFCKEASICGTDINLIIGRGKLVNKAQPEIQLQTLAEEGNITAIQELRKLSEQRLFENLIHQIDSNEL